MSGFEVLLQGTTGARRSRARRNEAGGRTADRPGPGPVPLDVVRALDLVIGRRVDGLLSGDHRAAAQGPGIELAQIRPYQPGDDVRHIDWNVTARTRELHVRVHVAERALTTWLLLDVSASMHFGTADRRKADVAEGVALAIGHLATRRGNRMGVITFGGPDPRVIGAAGGRRALLGILEAARQGPPASGGGGTSLGEALQRARAAAPRSGSVVIVSDFRGPRDWEAPLLELAARHDVLAVEIGDRREQDLPDVGELWLVDPETGRQLRVDTARRQVRERFAAAAVAERALLARTLTRAGARHVALTTAGDWLRPLAESLRSRTHRFAAPGFAGNRRAPVKEHA